MRDDSKMQAQKMNGQSQLQDVDKTVFKWFLDVHSYIVPISGSLIRLKTQEFSNNV